MNKSCMGLVAALVCVSALAQDEITVTTHKINDTLYWLEGQGGNVGVSAGEDGILIIDDQFERMAPAIRGALEELNAGDELKWVLNTHFHGDHTGGNPVFGKLAPIVAHENVRVRLAQGKDLTNKEERAPLPVVTYSDGVSIHFNGEEVRLKHYPTGHTDSDTVVFFTGSNVVHMGDHFFNGRFPFIDLTGGGDVEQYIANVKAVLDEIDNETQIIAGHGPMANKQDMADWIAGVEESVEIIREGAEAGKSAKDIVDAGLPEKFAAWGEGFVSTNRWIGIVHQSLTR